MAVKDPDDPAPTSAEQAMNRVLQAEHDARRTLHACEQEARRILHNARLRASRIASRTDERITLLQMRCAQRVAEETQSLVRTERADREQLRVELDEGGLAECIKAMALQLTGGNRIKSGGNSK